jgi:peptidoglycan hydrolase-like protein with peptidoglycan-binding domain
MKARPDRGRVVGGRWFSGRAGRVGAGDTGQYRARRGRALPLGVLLVALVVAGVGTGVALAHHRGVGSLLAGSAGAATPPPPLSPTRIVRLPPRTIANGTDGLGVTLSAPPATHSPRPTLRPAVAGTWSTVGDAEVFTPSSTLTPCSTYTLTVWADTIATGHSRVGRKHIQQLHVECPPLAGLQQELARLGYLPATLHPTYAVHLPPSRPESLHEAAVHAYRPFHGRLAPDPADAPPVSMGELDETTKGALEIFQADHNLEATGEPNAATWRLLLIVSSLYHRDRQPYTWVSVTESLPETLEVHRGDRVALTTPANTGVPGAETAQGIFPIYARYVTTTMQGTDVDGTKYDVPDVPWVNYFNGGDAVHGYPRASYGFPQSNGCVELPISTAAEVYPMLTIGDIVWVT